MLRELTKRFNVKYDLEDEYEPDIYNGFHFPKTAVISNDKSEEIQMFRWGLLPHWANDLDFRKNTLNARIETIHEKPSFKYSINQRCLILADSFFEWQWLDSKGRKKQQYDLSLPNKNLLLLQVFGIHI